MTNPEQVERRMADGERLARLEERVGRTESDVLDLRRSSVTTEVFEARMENVDLKLDGMVGVLTEVKESLNSGKNWRSGLTMAMLASLGSGLVVALATFFLNH